MTGAIPPLPRPDHADGRPRRVGVEIELGGLTEGRVAELARARFGGTLRREADYDLRLTGSQIGDIKVMLDTALRQRVDGALGRAGIELGRAVVPVELVTGPLRPPEILRIDSLCRDLAQAGATGTRDGRLLGFGLHLNVSEDLDPARVGPVLRGFALAEDWLRAIDPIDPARRLLPFVDSYRMRLLDRLAQAEAADWDMETLADTYLEHAPSRNHALDLLPLLRQALPGRVDAALGADHSVSARPAYHFRLPDARLGEPGWSVAAEWRKWVAVERIADDPALIAALAEAWRDFRRRPVHRPGAWAEASAPIIEAAGITA